MYDPAVNAGFELTTAMGRQTVSESCDWALNPPRRQYDTVLAATSGRTAPCVKSSGRQRKTTFRVADDVVRTDHLSGDTFGPIGLSFS